MTALAVISSGGMQQWQQWQQAALQQWQQAAATVVATVTAVAAEAAISTMSYSFRRVRRFNTALRCEPDVQICQLKICQASDFKLVVVLNLCNITNITDFKIERAECSRPHEDRTIPDCWSVLKQTASVCKIVSKCSTTSCFVHIHVHNRRRV